MSDLRQAARIAQDWMEYWLSGAELTCEDHPRLEDDVEALRAALDQHQPGPVTNLPSMYSSSLQCGWVAWTVVDSGILRLDMPGINVCDMRGAIKAAEALCPAVWRIDTYSGGKPDTMYVLRRGGWECVNRRSADVLFRSYPAMATSADSEGGEV